MLKQLIVLGIAATIGAVATARAQDAPKRLGAADLAVQTHKWDGKTVQTTAHCFYADVDEYRCIIGASGTTAVRVDFSEIEPPDIKAAIERDCDTITMMMSPTCKVQATFVYEANDPQEKMDGSILMLIRASDNKGEFARTR